MKEIIIKANAVNDYKDNRRFGYVYNINSYPCAEKLTAAIKTAEGRATARTLTPEDIIHAICRIEDELAIPKKAMEDLTVTVDVNNQSFPNAYQYTPSATIFTARFHGGSWRVTNVFRGICSKTFCHIDHTENSRAALVDRFSRF